MYLYNTIYKYLELSFDFIAALVIQCGVFYPAGKFNVENFKFSNHIQLESRVFYNLKSQLRDS